MRASPAYADRRVGRGALEPRDGVVAHPYPARPIRWRELSCGLAVLLASQTKFLIHPQADSGDYVLLKLWPSNSRRCEFLLYLRRAVSSEPRREWIEWQQPILSISRQCALAGVPRSTAYYEPVAVSAADLELMRRLDEQYTRTPFWGAVGAGDGAAGSLREAPHRRQNFAAAGLVPPQAAQGTSIFGPHSVQKSESARFSA
jgi:hypothetical protein